MNTSSLDLIDLLSMMVFSMLAALVVIDLLSARRRVRSSPRLRLWVQRLALAALSLAASSLAPSFAPAFLSAAVVLIVGLGRAVRPDRRDSVLLNIFERTA